MPPTVHVFNWDALHMFLGILSFTQWLGQCSQLTQEPMQNAGKSLLVVLFCFVSVSPLKIFTGSICVYQCQYLPPNCPSETSVETCSLGLCPSRVCEPAWIFHRSPLLNWDGVARKYENYIGLPPEFTFDALVKGKTHCHRPTWSTHKCYLSLP